VPAEFAVNLVEKVPGGEWFEARWCASRRSA